MRQPYIPFDEERYEEEVIEGSTTLLRTKGSADPIPLHIKKITIRTLIRKAQNHFKPAKDKKASDVVIAGNNTAISYLFCDEN